MPCSDAELLYWAEPSFADAYYWSIFLPGVGSILDGLGTDGIIVQWHETPFPSAFLILTSTVCGAIQRDTLEIAIQEETLELECPSPSSPDCRLCAGAPYTFTPNLENGEAYAWWVDGILMPDTTATATFTFNEPGTHYVKVRMTGSPSCPGIFEDVLVVNVVPNPDPVISPSNIILCEDPLPITMFATTYAGATTETFTWTVPTSYPASNPGNVSSFLLNLDATNVDDYLGFYGVSIVRDIDGLTCTADADYILDCIPQGDLLPNPDGDVTFVSWGFDLGVACGICRSTVNGNECGHVRVRGSIGNRLFADVELAQWRVFDPNDGLDLTGDVVSINDQIDLTDGIISRFTKPGFYQTALQVKFYGDADLYSDMRVIEIPLVPDFTWSLTCCDTLPGTYALSLHDISAQVPGSVITERDWIFSVDDGPEQVITDTLARYTTCAIPSGSTVKVCLTPYTSTIGADSVGIPYHCTQCITIDIPEYPTLDIALEQDSFCVGSIIELEAVSAPLNSFVQFDWDFGDLTGSSLEAPTKSYGYPGQQIITLTGKTDKGCVIEVSDTITILENMLWGEIIRQDTSCDQNLWLAFEQTTGDSIVHYEWSPGGQTTEMIYNLPTGLYQVTVTDLHGCTFSPFEPEEVIKTSPFLGGINGKFILCPSTSQSVYSVAVDATYDYFWETNFPSSSILLNGNLSVSIPTVDTPTTYFIKVYAMIDSVICSYIMENVVVNPGPPTLSFDIEYQCDPFLVTITETNNLSVNWNIATTYNYLGSGPQYQSYQGGNYAVNYSNSYGCTTSRIVTTKQAINMNLLSGCYALCDTLLADSTICLMAPPGSYDAWRWVLLPNELLMNGGPGVVSPLCLNDGWEGEIVLYVTRNLPSGPQLGPPDSIIVCTEVSDPFCLDVLECSTCPDLEVDVLTPTPLQCLMGGDDFDEQIIGVVNMQMHLPAAYEFCDSLPVFDGAYMVYNGPPTYFNAPPFPNYIVLNGTLHVTDVDKYNAGLEGTIQLCDRVTGELCPAKFQLRPDTCEEEIWCMYTFKVKSNGGFPQTVTIGVTFPAHYITGPECDITQYTATLYSVSGMTPTLLATQMFYGTPPADAMHTLTHTMLLSQYNALNCFYFVYESNCGQSCADMICVDEELPRTGERAWIHDVMPTLSLRPNPTSGTTVISYEVSNDKTSNLSELLMVNSQGAIVQRQLLPDSKGEFVLDVASWPAGLYQIVLIEDGTVVNAKRLVVAH